MYLVSPARLRFYQQLHRHTLDTSAENGRAALAASYVRSLQTAQHAYDQLQQDYHTADSVATITLEQTQRSLTQLDATLAQTEETLEQTTEQLRVLQTQLHRAERRARRRRRAYGLGGISIGLLVGAMAW